MRNLFIKKTFLGLVGLLMVVSLLVYPAKAEFVEAGGGTAYLPVVNASVVQQAGNFVFFDMNTTWKYWDKGQLPSDWASSSFNDSAWASGPAPLGYGEGNEATKVSYGSSSSSKYITTYFRKTFTVDNAAAVTSLSVNLDRDDAAVVYVNGKYASKSNMPSGSFSYSTLAYECSAGSQPKAIDPAMLVNGVNTIAVEVHQCTADSSDLRFAMDLTGNVSGTAPQPTAVPPTAAPTNTAVPPTAAPTQAPTQAPTAAPTLPPTSGNKFYVSSSGKSSNSGSQSSPWDFQTALNHPSAVKPGDTIFMMGGTYTGTFKTVLRGTSDKYITVRAMPGQRVTIKNSGSSPALEILNAWYLNFWGLEITSSYSTRSTSRSESTYGVRVNQGDTNKPHHVNFINCIIHDMQAQGIGWWQALTSSEIYGSLFYFNGTTELDHGIYVHSTGSGTKTLRDSMVFDNASHGYHGYAETTAKGLNNLTLIGNTFFNNGSVGYNTRQGKYAWFTRNILVGGLIASNNPVISENYTYHSGSAGTSLNLGYKGGSKGAKVTNNYFMGGQFAFGGTNSSVTMTGNTVYSPGGTSGFSKSSYSNNSWLSSKPTGVKVFVRRNLYEANRANITIFNWDKNSNVWVSASQLAGVAIKPGDRYELHNAQNFYGDVVTGVYDGSSIQVPMTGHSVAQPVGLKFKPASTFPEFGAFILIVNGQ